MTSFIAVHCGAGHHSEKNHSKYNRLSKRACRAGIAVLKRGGSALEAVKTAIIVLEDDPLTNAGYGSNLTAAGRVEADASVMCGATLLSGGCGAVRRVRNPVALAHDLCVRQAAAAPPLGLVPPALLVGEGALEHARAAGLRTAADDDELVGPRARRQHGKYRRLLDEYESRGGMVEEEQEEDVGGRLDTVGAVCVDASGRVASGCSSGGLLMKRPGRVGQAALYACGVWADSLAADEPSVAVSTTGCGEHLVRTQLAREIGTGIKNCSCPTTDLYKIVTDKFLNSRYLHNVKQKNGGALVLHVSKGGEVSILWAHTTESMSVAYMKSTDTQAKSVISQLPEDVQVGTKVNVSGSHFYLKR